MIELQERQNDIINMVRNLDISPTAYRNAVDKYHALANFLNGCGIEADIYPQGSFALGTVVRPVTKDPDAAYDLDFICQVRRAKELTAPSELRREIENVLNKDERYADRLELHDECFTIKYADVGEMGFSIDVVPAVDEALERKLELIGVSEQPDLLNTAIAIPHHMGGQNYDWLTNNPRGLRSWFEEVNRPFAEFDLENRRSQFFAENKQSFASVEEIPDGLMRSALQRVIQILKYHRDVYYLNLARREEDDLRPSSAVISVIVAEISKFADPSLGVFGLLKYVLDELCIYAEGRNLGSDEFGGKFEGRCAIVKSEKDGRWVVRNPANPEDNLADKWNDNDRIPECFFRWVRVCREDLIGSLSLPDHEFWVAMENAFGSAVVGKYWDNKYGVALKNKPEPFTTSPKPFSK